MRQGNLDFASDRSKSQSAAGKRPSSPIDLDADAEPPTKRVRREGKPEPDARAIADFVLPLSDCDSMLLHAPTFAMDATLFSDAAENVGRAIVKDKLDLLYFSGFLVAPGRHAFYEWLLAELPWYRVKYKAHGIDINTPRYTTVFGIDARPKALDKYAQRPRPIPPVLARFKEEVEHRIAADFNICLCNFYSDGQDSISFHQDSEQFLGPNPTIASLSLGSARQFQMRPVAEKGAKKGPIDSYMLQDGDMVVMRGPTQANWLHAIPKRTNAGPRINITLRKAMHPGGCVVRPSCLAHGVVSDVSSTENYLRYNIGTGPIYRYVDGKMRERPPG